MNEENEDDEPLTRVVRRAKRARSLGQGACCSACGTTDVTVLHRQKGQGKSKGKQNPVLCYECAAVQQGKTTIEEHHLLGRAIADITIGLPGNLHREVSDRQYDWPHHMRTNPDRDPLLVVAAICYTIRDLFAVLVSWLERCARWLIHLSDELTVCDGRQWWITRGVGTPWQEGPA